MTEWPVAVFAHNEEGRILNALRSLANQGTHLYVLANACSDATERVVADYVAGGAQATLVSIPLGDKSNAWNVFVHEVAPSADAYVFLDGDVTAEPGAVDALVRTLASHPAANAAAAVPRSGRSRVQLTGMVIEHRLVMGALYALSGTFVRRIRAQGTRIPVGYIGDDGWVTSLAKWNGDPAEPWDETRVAPCPEAGYVYRSFSPLRPRDWTTYWRRRVRYALRHFQHLLLRDALLAGGLPAMPARVADLYANRPAVAALRPRQSEFLFDWLALRQIRRTR